MRGGLVLGAAVAAAIAASSAPGVAWAAAPKVAAKSKHHVAPARKPVKPAKKSAAPANAAPAAHGPPPAWASTAASISAQLNDVPAEKEKEKEPAPVPAEPALAPPPAAAPTVAEAPVAPPALATSDRDRAQAPPSSPNRRLTVTLNPLPIVAGRYGLGVELVPARHHAIVASAWYQTFTPAMLKVIMPKEIDVSQGADARLGGELGYRFYTGSTGANGFFAGLSGVAMPIAYPRVTPELVTEVVSFHAYGGAFDIGLQAITSSGFTIGGGIGVMYLAWTPPTSVQPPPGVTVPSYPEPHVLPRLLLAAGWSF